MNKLCMTMVVVSSMFSLQAMEKEIIHEYVLKPITKDESNGFVKYAKSAGNYSWKTVEEKKIELNNALHNITCKYEEFLKSANNDLGEMVKQQGLQGRLEEFSKFEFDSGVIKIKDSIVSGLNLENSTEEVKGLFQGRPTMSFKTTQVGSDQDRLVKSLVERRKILAALNLKEKQPAYSIPKAGSADARVNSMIENKDYPLDEEAIKDYIATLIYRQVLAQRIVIYALQERSAAVVEEL